MSSNFITGNLAKSALPGSMVKSLIVKLLIQINSDIKII